MKRMIISPAQLKAINEASAAFTYNGMEPNDFNTELQNFTKANPSVKAPIVGVNTSDTATGASTTDINQANNAAQVILTGNTGNGLTTTIGESRYSKRQVELGRMLEMRRTGKVYSKKQLNEMFMETQDNVNRLENGLGNCLIFKIFDAVADVFGPEVEEEMKERFSNGEDPTMTIKDIFSREETEKQEEFLNALGI